MLVATAVFIVQSSSLLPAQLCPQEIAPIGGAGKSFAVGVAVDGDFAIVSAPHEQPSGAWVLRRSAFDDWQVEQQLITGCEDDIGVGDHVDISGNEALVASYCGVFMFRRSQYGVWVQDGVLAGAAWDGVLGPKLGGDYACTPHGQVYRRAGGAWPLIEELDAYGSCDTAGGMVVQEDGSDLLVFYDGSPVIIVAGAGVPGPAAGFVGTDGVRIAVSNNDDEVRIYNAGSAFALETVLPIAQPAPEVQNVAIDGDVVAAAGTSCDESTLWVWHRHGNGYHLVDRVDEPQVYCQFQPVSVSRLADRGRVIQSVLGEHATIHDVVLPADDFYEVPPGMTLTAADDPDPATVGGPSLVANDGLFWSDGPAISLVQLSDPAAGTVSIFDGQQGAMQYVAPNNSVGFVTFEYAVDAAGCSGDEVVTVELDVSLDPWIRIDWVFEPWPYYFIDTGDPAPWQLSAAELTVIDLHPTAPATFRIERQPDGGALFLVDNGAGGALVFLPDGRTTGETSISLTIVDGAGHVDVGTVPALIR